MRIIKAPEERKAELITAALSLFFQKGYKETTVRDIIAEVHGSQGMFYHYFTSKDDIFYEAMNQYVDNYIAKLRVQLKDPNVTLTKRVYNALLNLRDTFNNSIKVKAGNTDSVECKQFLEQIKQKILVNITDSVKTLIDDGIEAGIFKKEAILDGDTGRMADFVLYGIFGMVNHDLGTSQVDDSLIRAMITYSFRALGATEEMIHFILMEIAE
jgi:AcrR family transcriptional regulator